jgi:hypothetical protein
MRAGPRVCMHTRAPRFSPEQAPSEGPNHAPEPFVSAVLCAGGAETVEGPAEVPDGVGQGGEVVGGEAEGGQARDAADGFREGGQPVVGCCEHLGGGVGCVQRMRPAHSTRSPPMRARCVRDESMRVHGVRRWCGRVMLVMRTSSVWRRPIDGGIVSSSLWSSARLVRPLRVPIHGGRAGNRLCCGHTDVRESFPLSEMRCEQMMFTCNEPGWHTDRLSRVRVEAQFINV